MNGPGVTAIRIRRGDMVFHVHGEKAGQEGVYLAEGQVDGIHDAPVKTTWKSGAFQVGSRYKGLKREHRDMVLGFHLKETTNSYEFNESAFRQAFQYRLDPWDVDRTPTILEVETQLSGRRRLDVLMYEQPEFEAAIDPIKQQYGNLIMKLRAGNPDWYEDDYTDEFSSAASQASGFITVRNDTDQVAYHRFVLTPATWILPDPSWEGGPAYRQPGGAHPDRMVDNIKITAANGGAVVNWDRNELAFRDLHNTNIQGQLGSKLLLYPIPPNTPPTPLPIGYINAPAGGAKAELIVPQRWSRPWGMELVNKVDYLPPLGTLRFMIPGDWSYEIPPDCSHLDIVMLGGGGGGGAGGVVTGTGGSAGQWSTTTLVRGENLPGSTMLLTGRVGAGGRGGKGMDWFNQLDGADGEPSTCSADGMDTLVAKGGKGNGHKDHVSGDDVFGPTITFNGQKYSGGGTQGDPGASGKTPGGGGAGGWPFSRGGAGARGQVWIRAYRA